jgi:hypothetical protein
MLHRRSVGQSVLVSSRIWGSRPDFSYSQTVAGLLFWVALSHERMGLSFTIAAGRRQCSHSQVRVPQDTCPYFTVSDLGSDNLEGQVPVFISPRIRAAHLYPQARDSLSVALYDPQDYGGGNRTRLEAGNSARTSLLAIPQFCVTC